MALMTASELTPEQQRERDLDEAYSGNAAEIQGFKPVRRVTALVVDILRRVDNFFITGASGFRAIGIDPKRIQETIAPKINGKANPSFDPNKASAMVPKVAEVIALLTCTEQELDDCDDQLSSLGEIRRRVMKRYTMAEILEAMTDVQAEFTKINRSTAVVEDDESPGGGENAKKKQGRASAPATS